MSTRVVIWHNVATDERGRHAGFFGYKPGHPLVPVFTYKHTALATTGEDAVYQILNHAFHTFNVGEDLLAKEYRMCGNRSLSVGDVVCIIDERQAAWHACESAGWLQIDEPSWFAIGVRMHGTAPLAEQVLHAVWRP